MKDAKLIDLRERLLDANESKWESILKRAGLKMEGRDVKTMRFVIVSTESEFVRPLRDWLWQSGYSYQHDLRENIHRCWSFKYEMGDHSILLFSLCAFIPDEFVSWTFEHGEFFVVIQRPFIDFRLQLWDKYGDMSPANKVAIAQYWRRMKQKTRPHNILVKHRRGPRPVIKRLCKKDNTRYTE
jgi:hypothetical protein